MTAQRAQPMLVLLAAALLLAGCAASRPDPSVSPRKQAGSGVTAADLQTLEMKNEELRQQQEAQAERIDELEQQIEQERQKQRAFRETMTTNFDLLEQSVALTLSKGIGPVSMDDGGGKTAGKPEPAPERRPEPAPPPAAKAEAPQETPGKAPRPESGSRPRMTPPPATAGGAQDDGQRSGSGASSGSQPRLDRDLRGPSEPRQLTAHREAKPLYEKGFSLFANQDYAQAIIVFSNFLKRFPNDIYSDNAQFWIGESYLRMEQPEKAEAAYRQVLRNYEHRSTLEGFKTPDAMYRLGQRYQDSDDPTQARFFYQAAARRFPETSAGRKAQRELDALVANTAAN